MERGERPERPTHTELTDKLWALMGQCWDEDYEGRPEISEVLGVLRDQSVFPLYAQPSTHWQTSLAGARVRGRKEEGSHRSPEATSQGHKLQIRMERDLPIMEEADSQSSMAQARKMLVVPPSSLHQRQLAGFRKLRTKYCASLIKLPRLLFSAQSASESPSWPAPSWNAIEPKPSLVKTVTSCVAMTL